MKITRIDPDAAAEMSDADLYAAHEAIACALMALRGAPKGTRGRTALLRARTAVQWERAARSAAR